MSIIFGMSKAEGEIVEHGDLLELANGTARYALDGTFVRAYGRFGMGFQPHHTHGRSNLELQPVADERGNSLTLDGRLDNHAELSKLLDIQRGDTSDSQIALAAFERWGADCFSLFIGDWAIALWSHSDRSLYLARDHAGTRTLYFEYADGAILWSTFLETFFVQKKPRDIDDRFVASYLGCRPVYDLTPYKTIRSVPPAHYLKLCDRQIVQRHHWHWLGKNLIQYRTDSEYEEHFLCLLRQSVRRRTGSGAPILAELSGGIDSSSIICMFDLLERSLSDHEFALLNTVSYYDDKEPGWNERPYFSIIEQHRGKGGFHIRTSFDDWTCAPSDCPYPACLPGVDRLTINRERELNSALQTQESRVIVSGIGGDEMLGGIHSPMADLSELAFSLNMSGFLRRTVEWSLVDCNPILHTADGLMRYLARLSWKPHPIYARLPIWLQPKIANLCQAEKEHLYVPRWRPGISPSRIENAITWWALLETLPHLLPSPLHRYEYRYPYLDRDLIDFLFQVPREQLVRPGERRSLMRRSLRTIVPEAILERRRKAFISRGPLAALRREKRAILRLFEGSVAAKMGYIKQSAIQAVVESDQDIADPSSLPALMRAIYFESWLRARMTSYQDSGGNHASHDSVTEKASRIPAGHF